VTADAVPRVVVAPDKFKGSLTAAGAAAALAAGLRRGAPGADVVELPVADGGDGTVAAALAAGFRPAGVRVEGPAGGPVDATIAVRGRTAVVELADTSGLGRLPGGALAPLTASTYGVGQAIRAALDRGATRIVLGLGGSASTDGGAGMMQALGLRLADDSGREIGRGGAALGGLAAIDAGGLDSRLGTVTFLVASDVDNPLLGPRGAAAVFGPQKGAGRADVTRLGRALARWAALTAGAVAGADLSGAGTGADLAGAPGAGAAGGTGFAALAYLGARLVPGIDLVLDLVGFRRAAAGARLVVTGEGTLDRQTLGGKAPLGVARAAGRLGVPAVAVAGRVLLSEAELTTAGFAAAYSLAAVEPDPAASMARAAELLALTGTRIAERWC